MMVSSVVWWYGGAWYDLRGGSRIFSQGGSGGTQTHCHRDAAGVSGEGTEGGLGGLPQENFEYEVL